jgi:hypothetical protein
MTDGLCGGCGATLDGRFCGGCGADSTVVPVVPLVPIEPLGPDEFPAIGELYASTWQTLRGHIADWVITIVLAIALLGVFGLFYGIYVWATTKQFFKGSGLTYREPIPVVDLFFFAVFVLVVVAIRYAFTRTALAIARGQKPNPVEAWSPKRLLPFAVFELIAYTLWFAGWLVPFVGPIAVIGLVMYAPFSIIDGGSSGVTGLWRSLSMTATRARFASQFGFAFLQTVLFFVPFGIWTFLQAWLGFAKVQNWSSAPKALFELAALAVAGVAAIITGITVISAAASAYVRLDDRS